MYRVVQRNATSGDRGTRLILKRYGNPWPCRIAAIGCVASASLPSFINERRRLTPCAHQTDRKTALSTPRRARKSCARSSIASAGSQCFGVRSRTMTLGSVSERRDHHRAQQPIRAVPFVALIDHRARGSQENATGVPLSTSSTHSDRSARRCGWPSGWSPSLFAGFDFASDRLSRSAEMRDRSASQILSVESTRALS